MRCTPMTTIKLLTMIQAPVHTCFDVSRDIQVHERSTEKTKERAIAGKTSGLCELNDEITWQATHFGIRQKLTVRITQFNRPVFFEDVMLKGAFQSMRHEHHFRAIGQGTEMIDIFKCEVPLGPIGKLFDRLVLRKYMTTFLSTRNEVIKAICEKANV